MKPPYNCAIASPKKESKLKGLKSFIAYQLTPSVRIFKDYKFSPIHSALKLEKKSAISKVQKHIICIFKNGKKSIFALEKSLKLPKMQFSD